MIGISRIKIIDAAVQGQSRHGFYLFFRSDILNYMLFKNPFAFLDYSKAWWLVLIENLAMLLAWAFAAYLISLCLKKLSHQKKGGLSKQ